MKKKSCNCDITRRRDNGKRVKCNKPVVWSRRKSIVVGRAPYATRIVVQWNACAEHRKDVQDNHHDLTTAKMW